MLKTEPLLLDNPSCLFTDSTVPVEHMVEYTIGAANLEEVVGLDSSTKKRQLPRSKTSWERLKVRGVIHQPVHQDYALQHSSSREGL